MNMNGITAYTNTMAQSVDRKSQTAKTDKASDAAKTESTKRADFSEDAAVYKPSSTGVVDKVVEKAATDSVTEKAVVAENKASASTDRATLIKQLQDDAFQAKQSMLNMVRDMLGQQAGTAGLALGEDEIWQKLANGEVKNVSEAARAEAQAAIADDGYWGVEQTSQRIVDFAKALAGDDVSKADKLLDAFKKGYEQATKSWGKELPEISKKTYEAVEKKFDEWKNGSSTAVEEDTV